LVIFILENFEVSISNLSTSVGIRPDPGRPIRPTQGFTRPYPTWPDHSTSPLDFDRKMMIERTQNKTYHYLMLIKFLINLFLTNKEKKEAELKGD
jgi:hypothetical protein